MGSPRRDLGGQRPEMDVEPLARGVRAAGWRIDQRQPGQKADSTPGSPRFFRVVVTPL